MGNGTESPKAHGVPKQPLSYGVEEVHLPDELPRLYLTDSRTGRRVSSWSDVPLAADQGAFNMVAEIPRFAVKKLECRLDLPLHPIVQDIKKGKPREYHGPIYWSYGFLPQTWEDPTKELAGSALRGDGDPVDCVELSGAELTPGTVTAVRVLGALPMVDDGEIDWKVLVWRADDPSGPKDAADLEAKFPHLISGVREWFRWYKAKDGVINSFLHEGVTSTADTLAMIADAHEDWRRAEDAVLPAADLKPLPQLPTDLPPKPLPRSLASSSTLCSTPEDTPRGYCAVRGTPEDTPRGYCACGRAWPTVGAADRERGRKKLAAPY